MKLHAIWLSLMFAFLSQSVHAVEKIDNSDWAKNYQVFANADEARREYRESIEPIVAKMSGLKAARSVVDASDAKYGIANEAVSKIFKQFQSLYPGRYSSLSAPPVAIIQDDEANAFALGKIAPSSTAIPYLFVIQTGLFKMLEKSEDGFYGVIAHELAHLLLLHSASGTDERIGKYYLVPSRAQESVGFLKKNNAALARDMERWVDFAKDAGALAIPEMNGLPTTLTPTFDLDRFLSHIVDKHVKDEACQKRISFKLYLLKMNIIENYFDQETLNYKFDAEGLSSIKSDTADIRTEIAQCTQYADRIGYKALFNELSGLDADQILKDSSQKTRETAFADIRVFDAAPEALTGILALVKVKQDEMMKLQKKWNLNQVRVYSSEEQADDLSVQVLHGLGMDPNGIARFFIRMMTTEQAESCRATIKKGEVPVYGSLSLNHRTHCYRIYHAGETAKYLKTQKVAKPLDILARETAN